MQRGRITADMGQRHRIQRSALLTGLVAVVAVGGISSSAAPSRVAADSPTSNGPYSLVSSSPGVTPSVSANGQFVVYVAAPATADGRTKSVWIDDRTTNISSELTVPKDGLRLGDSVNPVISSDGCVVVVTTEMSYDLFRDDDRGSRWDVYRTTLPGCGGRVNDWTLVSTRINDIGQAEARNDIDPSAAAALSSSGSVVAYVRPFESASGATSLTTQPDAIDVVDLSIQIDDRTHTTPAPGLPTEVSDSKVTYAGQRSPALSADGTYLVFSSDATSSDAVPDWVSAQGNATTVPSEVFAWSRAEADPFKAVTLVSEVRNVPADQSAVTPSISADGRFVAFSSSATNLVPTGNLAACGSGCPAQIYLADRDADNNQVYGESGDGQTSVSLLSAVPSDDHQSLVAGDGASFDPTMTSDGQTVVFATQASNLMKIQTAGGGDSGDGDVLVADVASKTLRRGFDTPTPTPGAYSHPHVSANGRLLVADTLVADRLIGDPTLTDRRVVSASIIPTVSLADSDFGTIAVGVPGQEWYLNVINAGPGSFVPASVTISNPAFTITKGSCLDNAPVAAGQYCSVMMILTPTAPGPVAATLTVAEAGFGAISVSAAVKGAGGDPALFTATSAADFGSIKVGQSSPGAAHFDIVNVGLSPAAIGSITIGGADAGDFKVSANGCHAVDIGGTCGIEVVFKPTDSGRRTATIKVSTVLGQYTSMLLSGYGFYAPKLIGNTAVTPGQNLGIGGNGFPPNTAVTLGWSDGRGRTTTIITDAHGDFLTNVFVPRSERAGTRTLIGQMFGGQPVTTDVQIRRPASSGSSNVATWND